MMLTFFAERVRGKWVAILAIVSIGYGVLILQVLPWWGRLIAAQGGSELQQTFSYDAEHVAGVLGAFDSSLRSDALSFYAVDTPNAILFAMSVAALMGFGLRLCNAAQTRLRWLIVLPLLSGASDIAENACLAAALLTSPTEPTSFGTLAGVATALKFSTGALSLALMPLLLAGGLVRWAWIALRTRRA